MAGINLKLNRLGISGLGVLLMLLLYLPQECRSEVFLGMQQVQQKSSTQTLSYNHKFNHTHTYLSHGDGEMVGSDYTRPRCLISSGIHQHNQKLLQKIDGIQSGHNLTSVYEEGNTEQPSRVVMDNSRLELLLLQSQSLSLTGIQHILNQTSVSDRNSTEKYSIVVMGSNLSVLLPNRESQQQEQAYQLLRYSEERENLLPTSNLSSGVTSLQQQKLSLSLTGIQLIPSQTSVTDLTNIEQPLIHVMVYKSVVKPLDHLGLLKVVGTQYSKIYFHQDTQGRGIPVLPEYWYKSQPSYKHFDQTYNLILVSEQNNTALLLNPVMEHRFVVNHLQLLHQRVVGIQSYLISEVSLDQGHSLKRPVAGLHLHQQQSQLYFLNGSNQPANLILASNQDNTVLHLIPVTVSSQAVILLKTISPHRLNQLLKLSIVDHTYRSLLNQTSSGEFLQIRKSSILNSINLYLLGDSQSLVSRISSIIPLPTKKQSLKIAGISQYLSHTHTKNIYLLLNNRHSSGQYHRQQKLQVKINGIRYNLSQHINPEGLLNIKPSSGITQLKKKKKLNHSGINQLVSRIHSSRSGLLLLILISSTIHQQHLKLHQKIDGISQYHNHILTGEYYRLHSNKLSSGMSQQTQKQYLNLNGISQYHNLTPISHIGQLLFINTSSGMLQLQRKKKQKVSGISQPHNLILTRRRFLHPSSKLSSGTYQPIKKLQLLTDGLSQQVNLQENFLIHQSNYPSFGVISLQQQKLSLRQTGIQSGRNLTSVIDPPSIDQLLNHVMEPNLVDSKQMQNQDLIQSILIFSTGYCPGLSLIHSVLNQYSQKSSRLINGFSQLANLYLVDVYFAEDSLVVVLHSQLERRQSRLRVGHNLNLNLISRIRLGGIEQHLIPVTVLNRVGNKVMQNQDLIQSILIYSIGSYLRQDLIRLASGQHSLLQPKLLQLTNGSSQYPNQLIGRGYLLLTSYTSSTIPLHKQKLLQKIDGISQSVSHTLLVLTDQQRSILTSSTTTPLLKKMRLKLDGNSHNHNHILTRNLYLQITNKLALEPILLQKQLQKISSINQYHNHILTRNYYRQQSNKLSSGTSQLMLKQLPKIDGTNQHHNHILIRGEQLSSHHSSGVFQLHRNQYRLTSLDNQQINHILTNDSLQPLIKHHTSEQILFRKAYLKTSGISQSVSHIRTRKHYRQLNSLLSSGTYQLNQKSQLLTDGSSQQANQHIDRREMLSINHSSGIIQQQKKKRLNLSGTNQYHNRGLSEHNNLLAQPGLDQSLNLIGYRLSLNQPISYSIEQLTNQYLKSYSHRNRYFRISGSNQYNNQYVELTHLQLTIQQQYLYLMMLDSGRVYINNPRQQNLRSTLHTSSTIPLHKQKLLQKIDGIQLILNLGRVRNISQQPIYLISGGVISHQQKSSQLVVGIMQNLVHHGYRRIDNIEQPLLPQEWLYGKYPQPKRQLLRTSGTNQYHNHIRISHSNRQQLTHTSSTIPLLLRKQSQRTSGTNQYHNHIRISHSNRQQYIRQYSGVHSLHSSKIVGISQSVSRTRILNDFRLQSSKHSSGMSQQTQKQYLNLNGISQSVSHIRIVNHYRQPTNNQLSGVHSLHSSKIVGISQYHNHIHTSHTVRRMYTLTSSITLRQQPRQLQKINSINQLVSLIRTNRIDQPQFIQTSSGITLLLLQNKYSRISGGNQPVSHTLLSRRSQVQRGHLELYGIHQHNQKLLQKIDGIQSGLNRIHTSHTDHLLSIRTSSGIPLPIVRNQLTGNQLVHNHIHIDTTLQQLVFHHSSGVRSHQRRLQKISSINQYHNHILISDGYKLPISHTLLGIYLHKQRLSQKIDGISQSVSLTHTEDSLIHLTKLQHSGLELLRRGWSFQLPESARLSAVCWVKELLFNKYQELGEQQRLVGRVA